MNLGAMMESGYFDDYGNPIMIDPATGDIISTSFGAADAGVAPSAPITDPMYQDYGIGAGTSWLVAKGKATAEYVADAPETVLPGDAAIDVTKLIVDAAGKYYAYQKRTAPTGEIYYTRMAATPAGGISPLMLAAIAGIALLALS